QNLIDAHAGSDLHLTDTLTLSLEHHIFWRQNTNDAVYNLAGGTVRPDNGSGSPYLGNEFDVVLNYQLDQHWSAYIGYAHFFTGEFFNQTGSSADVDFFYAAATFTF